MSLWILPKHKSALIEGFSENLPAGYLMRLRELGFEKHEKVRCLKKAPFRGPRVYQVGDSVFSMAQDIAELIYIREDA